MSIVYAFGDSLLDSGAYNERGLTPGQLLVKNDDALFPEFRGWDLSSRRPASLVHLAEDGATVDSLPGQVRRAGTMRDGGAIALLSVGGNDLLQGLGLDTGDGVRAFAHKLEAVLKTLPAETVLIANVYDPTFGDDARNFLGWNPGLVRANHRRMNAALADLAERYGRLADVHGHFLKGEPG